MIMGPRATIHLGNIAYNWGMFADRAKPGVSGAVVKANAYGHGAADVSRALHQAGCRHFFVAYAEEGAVVRDAIGADAEIYVFQGGVAGTAENMSASDLTPVLNSFDDITSWKAIGANRDFALHIDTGMNRLGLSADQLSDVRDALAGLRPKLIISHLASADTPNSRQNRSQLEAFRAASDLFPGVATSLQNSAGHWLDGSFKSDLSRPGIGLYGGGNSPARPAGLKPGLTLEAHILQVFEVSAGETVGYGATATLERDSVLATIGLGYEDGIPRAASNSGFAYLGDERCAFIGRVSMDLITLDVTAAAPLAKVGGLVEVIGARADLEEQAAAARTLGYELITGLGARVQCIYED